MTNVIGAIAPVNWTDSLGGDEVVMFVIGDTEEELTKTCDDLWKRFYDELFIQTITVIEVSHKEWWDVKHGTNISKGFYINDTSQIELIKETAQ